MSARRSRSQRRQDASRSGHVPARDGFQDDVTSLRKDVESLRRRTTIQDEEIDGLQLKATEKSLPWYRSVNSAIPVLTLIFSLITFLISAYWSSAQQEVAEQRLAQEEQRTARLDLRTLLQQLYDLDTREGEVLATGNPSMVELSNIYAEMGLLATQARDAADRAEDGVSTTEYMAVAWYLYRSGDNESAGRMYRNAIDVVSTATEYATAHRSYGAFLMNTGRLDEGREQFALAVRVDEQFPGEDASYLATLRAEVEMRWAESELAHGQCAQAEEHFRTAQELLDGNDGPSTAGWRQNLAQLMEGWEDRVAQCQPPGS